MVQSAARARMSAYARVWQARMARAATRRAAASVDERVFH